ncbi:hypothetical protein G7062_03955 [Erysipelothrix sp. HDW6C]|uniref:MutS-related protein n=1 Tax=Erysipelothrix sp. HDW6C TaxID=2714930 RepID=UPI00140DC7FC|nr:hypothetical protein [Erysipelothrix sp. HDW6C]QIK69499.1 hypothetical protein G7062_03955 [Erysipelothrix sp. HDW6C]
MDITFWYVVASIILIIIVLRIFAYIQKQQILRLIRTEYGVNRTQIYDGRRIDQVARYYYQLRSDSVDTLDDQTWLDLQMNEIFRTLDYTQSSIGSEYLYAQLRQQNKINANRFEEQVTYFSNHPNEREALQYEFRMMKTKDDNKFVEHIASESAFASFQTGVVSFMGIMGFFTTLYCILYPSSALEDGLGIIAIGIILIGQFMMSSAIYERTKDTWDTMIMFCKVFKKLKVLEKLDPNVFEDELKEVARIKKAMTSHASFVVTYVELTMGSSSANAIFYVIAAFYGLYGIALQQAKKLFIKNRGDILSLYDLIGHLETCIAVASYRQFKGEYCTPTFHDSASINAVSVYHPLIKKPVKNTKHVDRLSMVTGANASGKTTFARTLAVNVVLSQTINTAMATAFQFKLGNVYSSITISDDLLGGDSFYMAEIKRLKEMVSLSQGGTYTMFFMDEMLKGTNAVERIAAASTILDTFAQGDCFLLLTTHDIELTQLLGSKYSNYHFKEVTTDQEITYDYRIYDGITTGSNAIALLRVCNYDEDIVVEAQKRADHYGATNTWIA